MLRIFTDQEVATILHALRVLQDGPVNERDACDHFETCTPMDNEQIDSLCESINLDRVYFGEGSASDSQKLAALRKYLENEEFGADSLDEIWSIIGEEDGPSPSDETPSPEMPAATGPVVVLVVGDIARHEPERVPAFQPATKEWIKSVDPEIYDSPYKKTA